MRVQVQCVYTLSVCLSVCLSVTLVHSLNTAEQIDLIYCCVFYNIRPVNYYIVAAPERRAVSLQQLSFSLIVIVSFVFLFSINVKNRSERRQIKSRKTHERGIMTWPVMSVWHGGVCRWCVEDDFTADEYRCLQKELDIMKRLQPHPNITALLGCCTATSKFTSTASRSLILQRQLFVDTIRYDTIRWSILTCAYNLTNSQLNLPHGTEQTKNNEETKNKITENSWNSF